MSTRSRIGIHYSNDKVKTIYCHFDGYPSHQMPILQNHYNSIEDVKKLLSFGDASVLDISIDKCIFYARYRGENKNNTEASTTNTYKKFIDDILKNVFIEYVYLFSEDKNEWICIDVYKLKSLTEIEDRDIPF